MLFMCQQKSTVFINTHLQAQFLVHSHVKKCRSQLVTPRSKRARGGSLIEKCRGKPETEDQRKLYQGRVWHSWISSR